jgi:hypothetical protein
MKTIHLILVLICAFVHTGTLAATYTFAGPTYGNPTPFTAPCATPTCANFTVAMKQTGSFTTAAPLAPNLGNAFITNLIQSYSFSDGITHFSSADPESHLLYATVSTDATGNIIGENIAVNRWQTADHGVNGRLNAMSINLASWSNAYCQNLSGPDVCSLMAEDASTSYVFAHANNGWTRSIASASVPTLGDWGLLALTCLMVTLGWPRVRQRTAASSAAL